MIYLCLMSSFSRTVQFIENRRDNILSGNFNCIPNPFERFSNIWAGIEQRKYYLISANSKVGKSQITDFLFLYHAYSFCKENGIPLKIFYFSLEQDKRTKIMQCFSHMLFIRHGIRISPQDLRSTKKAVNKEIVKKIKEMEDYFQDFEKVVTFYEDIKNPFGIYKEVRRYCEENGRTFTKKFNTSDKEYFDYYLPNKPNEYVITIIDHASLLIPENGGNLREAMNDMSKYNILLRNNYGVTPVLIQQQASAQESVENFKIGKLVPSFAGLADCKDTQRDIDLALGLFTPFRHEIEYYHSYNIKKFKDNIRFMNIMGGREGGFGEIAPLFFDGAVNLFSELPLPTDKAGLEKVYNHISKFRPI